MPVNRESGLKAKATNLKNDPEYYNKLGTAGGKKGKKDGVIKGVAKLSTAKRREIALLGVAGRKKKLDSQP